MTKTTARDWIEHGLMLLREQGETALTIERLCRALGRTKGAFYHHFQDIEVYHAALLAHWERALTLEPIQLAQQVNDAEERRERLGEIVRGLDHRLDFAVRAWASREPRARWALERVDAERLGYLTSLWSERLGRRAGALTFARLEYAAFIGAAQLYPELSSRKLEELAATLSSALLALDR